MCFDCGNKPEQLKETNVEMEGKKANPACQFEIQILLGHKAVPLFALSLEDLPSIFTAVTNMSLLKYAHLIVLLSWLYATLILAIIP